MSDGAAGSKELAGEFDALVAASRRMFDAAHVDAAYHALAAAMHLADDMGDERRIGDVGAIAAEQLAWLDEHAPENKHSTRSAASRGNPGVYAALREQCHAASLPWRAERAVADSRELQRFASEDQEKDPG